jgi:hypothetical protein
MAILCGAAKNSLRGTTTVSSYLSICRNCIRKSFKSNQFADGSPNVWNMSVFDISRIRILDSWVKKAPDPGSGSATLLCYM